METSLPTGSQVLFTRRSSKLARALPGCWGRYDGLDWAGGRVANGFGWLGGDCRSGSQHGLHFPGGEKQGPARRWCFESVHIFNDCIENLPAGFTVTQRKPCYIT